MTAFPWSAWQSASREQNAGWYGLNHFEGAASGEERVGRGVHGVSMVSSFDFTRQSTARSEFAGDAGPDRATGLDDILENTIHGILVKNA